MKNRTERSQKLLMVITLLSISYYLWLAAQIPYCHDDWDWGLPIGIQQLLTANLNGRYIGNFIEVLLTRSTILKTAFMGLVFSFIPLAAVRVISLTGFSNTTGDSAVPAVILGNVLMLSLPHQIWGQTFGWVAGFSNFVVSALLLLLYQILAVKLLRDENDRIFRLALTALFGVTVQLLLENVAIYVLACSSLLLLFILKNKRKTWKSALGLWAGNIVGTLILFSSSIYTTLAETGTAIDGYRTLSYDRSAGLFSIAIGFVRRFLILYPDQIWIRNTVLCCVILLLLTMLQKTKQRAAGKRLGWPTVNLLLFIYTIFHRITGDIQLPSQWWTNVLRAGIASLFFAVVLLQAVLLFRDDKIRRNLFLFCWLSAPAVLLPMVVIESVGWRSYLTSDIFLLETCLLLFMRLTEEDKYFKKSLAALSVAALCIVWVYFGVVYYDIGTVRKQRLDAIAEAKAGNTQSIFLNAFPHGKYLWCQDPEYGSERVVFFREFYQIPENSDIWFQTWVDDGD